MFNTKKSLNAILLFTLTPQVLLAQNESTFHTHFWDFLDKPGYFEALLMTGISTIDFDGSIRVTSQEKDKLVSRRDGYWDTWNFQAGVGYVQPFLENCPENTIHWFPAITPQFNVYILNNNKIDGDVHRFEQAQYNQANFYSHFGSTRLMFDLGLTVASVRNFSLYALAGLGISWNSTDFELIPDPNYLINGLQLSETHSTGFAYEFGGGVTYSFDTCFGISIQYLYTGFNNVKIQGESNGYRVNSDLDVNAQSLMLGLRIAI